MVTSSSSVSNGLTEGPVMSNVVRLKHHDKKDLTTFNN